MSFGFIAIHRKMVDWEWYCDLNTKSLFIHLLLKANYKRKRWQGNRIDRGQLVTSIKSLSSETGISEQSVRTSLNKLKSTGEITTKSTNRFTIVTVCNYETYQSQSCETNNPSNDQSTINQQSTNKQLTTTNKENKENKETRYDGLGENEVSTSSESPDQFSLEIDPPKKQSCPFKEIVKLYHETCISLPRILKDLPSRRTATASLWKTYKGDLAAFKEVFEAAERSDFLTGRKPSQSHPRFRADFDWIMKTTNFTKVYEGKYDNE